MLIRRIDERVWQIFTDSSIKGSAEDGRDVAFRAGLHEAVLPAVWLEIFCFVLWRNVFQAAISALASPLRLEMLADGEVRAELYRQLARLAG